MKSLNQYDSRSLYTELGRKIEKECLHVGSFQKLHAIWMDLNSGPWSLFQSNIKRDLYKKSCWLYVWVTSTWWKYLSAQLWSVDGGWKGILLHVCFCESTSPPGVKAQTENRTQSRLWAMFADPLSLCHTIMRIESLMWVWVNSSGRSEWAHNVQCHPTFIPTKSPTSAEHMHITFPISANHDNCVKPAKHRWNCIQWPFFLDLKAQ